MPWRRCQPRDNPKKKGALAANAVGKRKRVRLTMISEDYIPGFTSSNKDC